LSYSETVVFKAEKIIMKNRKRTRSDDPMFNPKRKLRAWDGGADDESRRAELSELVSYTGNPAHKRNPGDFALHPPAAPRQGATLCDDAKVFGRADAEALLRMGAQMGLVDGRPTDRFPLLIWAVRQDGVVFEAKLENPEKGEYHGYPMPTSDPFREKVLEEVSKR
jgi:hypothetical protein